MHPTSRRDIPTFPGIDMSLIHDHDRYRYATTKKVDGGYWLTIVECVNHSLIALFRTSLDQEEAIAGFASFSWLEINQWIEKQYNELPFYEGFGI